MPGGLSPEVHTESSLQQHPGEAEAAGAGNFCELCLPSCCTGCLSGSSLRSLFTLHWTLFLLTFSKVLITGLLSFLSYIATFSSQLNCMVSEILPLPNGLFWVPPGCRLTLQRSPQFSYIHYVWFSSDPAGLLAPLLFQNVSCWNHQGLLNLSASSHPTIA